MKTIGYFLGVTLGASLVFFLISFIFFKPRNVKEKQIIKFIENSDKILVTNEIPLFTPFDNPIPDTRLGLDTKTKITYFSNRNMKYVYADTYTYFSNELNKYIKTYYLSIKGNNLFSSMMKFGKKNKDKNIYPDMYFYYNKAQNIDPSYGTIDKPLPILHFRSANPALKSMRKENKDADEAYLKKVYEENVKLYLGYFIEKEDFKKLFPKE